MLKARLGAHVLCETVGCSGAAFSLVKPARKSDAIAFDGWVVEVTKGETLVVARGGSETNSRDAYEQALCKSQKGLDILSLNGDNSLLIKDASDSNVVWHASSDGLIIKITTTRTTSIETTLEITSTDADGNVVPRLPRSTLWHESFRYYRLSQATDDLFDGYRNVYLALESVLSSIAPQYLRNGKVNEGEGAWFRRALGAAGGIVDLNTFVPAATPDAVDFLFEELFQQMRSAMSHAKSGRKILLPQSESERRAVTESLLRLNRLYRSLSEVHLDTRRLRTSITPAAFRAMSQAVLGRIMAFASSIADPKGESSDVGLLPELDAIKLTPDGDVDHSVDFLGTREFSVAGELLSRPIERVVGLMDGVVAMTTELDAPLYVGENCARLEAIFGLRAVGAGEPRERYSS